MAYNEPIAESKKNHVWRKTVWHSDPDEHPLTPASSVEVYCCEESNGYGVWYIRKLGKSAPAGLAGTENGDYLLRFFSKVRRDEALEWAVLISNSAADATEVILNLDRRVAEGQKI